MEFHRIIPDFQYSYSKNKSIFNQHIDLQKVILDNLNDKSILCVDLVFLDLTSAFDLVPQDKLLIMLNQYGFSGKILKLLCDSFLNRKQFIKFNGVDSEFTFKYRGLA